MSVETGVWEVRIEPLKVTSFRGRVLWNDLEDLGREGWELLRILPLPEPDEKGPLATTVAAMLLRRCSPPVWEFRYVPLKVTRNVGARFDLEGGDRLGREGWELVRVEDFPQPDPQGIIDQTVGIQVFRRRAAGRGQGRELT